MKTKTSITLSSDLLEALAPMERGAGGRSALIERVLREFLARRAQEARDARDVAIINRRAARLNAEAQDALKFQDEP